jgi:hypothetical protein
MLEMEKTPVMTPIKRLNPFDVRKEKMAMIAQLVGKQLGMADIRFLSKSTRLFGAYTYAAVDKNNENVVIKIQPANELDGYRRARQIISRLPSDIAIHLPTIYKVAMLEDILHTIPDEIENDVPDLGVIVMERLEELPGNMFDMITSAPKSSDQSLQSFLNDREAFTAIVNDVIAKKMGLITSVINRHSVRKDIDIDSAIERLRMQIGRSAFTTERKKDQEQSSPSLFDTFIKQVMTEIDLWCLGMGISDKSARNNIARQLSDTITSALGKRAVPREPKSEKAGPLSRAKGIKELITAINKLIDMDIEPSDLHGNNIMIRPESGELVLADLGHFS